MADPLKTEQVLISVTAISGEIITYLSTKDDNTFPNATSYELMSLKSAYNLNFISSDKTLVPENYYIGIFA